MIATFRPAEQVADVATYQKTYCSANCILRGSLADWVIAPRPAVLDGTIWPKIGDVRVRTGLYRLTQFGRLNASPRISRFWCSRIENTLDSAALRMKIPGPRTAWAPIFP